jgi:hypothetical protein
MLKILRAGLVLSGVGLLMACGGQTATVSAGSEDQGPPGRPSLPRDDSPGSTPIVVPPTPTQHGPTDPPPPPIDPSMTLGPNTCLTLVEGGVGRNIMKIDLVSGAQILGPSLTESGKPLLSEMTSIGVKDGAMWLCNNNQGVPNQMVTKVSLTTGIATRTTVPCRAVTASDDGIFVLANDAQTVTRYADETAINAGTPSGTSLGAANSYSIGAGASGALTTRYQDTQVVSASGTVTLAGYSGYIFGVGEASGGRIIVSSPAIFGGTGTLESFDAATGAHLGTVATFHGPTGFAGFWGLACAR